MCLFVKSLKPPCSTCSGGSTLMSLEKMRFTKFEDVSFCEILCFC
nr:MAG TPA: PROTEIN G PROTEIN G OF BOVINE [Caudoviricetes sp.]